MSEKLTTLQTAAQKTGIDSRKLAQALLAAAEQPAATLVQPNGEKPLFHADRVDQLAAELLAIAKRESK